MKRVRAILMVEFYASIIIALCIVALYEFEVIVMGNFTVDEKNEFMWATIMELITLIVIPLALKLFKIGMVKKRLNQTGEKALLRWGTLRILLLAFPLIFNTLLYYLFMATTFGYMAIILLLCMPFVYPALGKCYYEVSTVREER